MLNTALILAVISLVSLTQPSTTSAEANSPAAGDQRQSVKPSHAQSSEPQSTPGVGLQTSQKNAAPSSDSLRVEPRLLWARKFEKIEDVTMSADGTHVLVSTAVDIRGKHTNKRHVLDRGGTVVAVTMGEGGVLSGDGKRIIGRTAVEDLHGNALGSYRIRSLGHELIVYSPARRYFAVIPGYEAYWDHAFLRVYDGQDGGLLWETTGPECTFLTAAFCSEDTIAVYSQGKITLYGVRTGDKYWTKVLAAEGAYPEGDAAIPPVQLAPSLSGEVAALFYKSEYESAERHRRNESKIYSLSTDGDVRWQYENSHWGWLMMSPGGKYVAAQFDTTLLFFDNATGESLWRREFVFGYPPHGAAFSDGDTLFLIVGHLSGDGNRYRFGTDHVGRELKWTKSSVYAFDAFGNIVWRKPLEAPVGSGDLQVLISGNSVLVSDVDALYLFDVSRSIREQGGGRGN